MRIHTATFYSSRELLARLKLVTMLNKPDVQPYTQAEIQLTDIHTTQLNPAQLYVLRPEFEKVRAVRWAFLDQFKIDILRLPDRKLRDGVLVSADFDRAESVGFVEFSLTDKPDEIITILPPVIECWVEADKNKVNIINDGMHRCYLARTSHITPAVVKIVKIPAHLPYYAFPLVGGWDDVHMVDRLEPSLLKKFHRFPEPQYKEYYRNFNSAFANVGGPRGKG